MDKEMPGSLPPLLVNGAPIAYDQVPVYYMHTAVSDYIEYGLLGDDSFLTPFVCNDLKRTFEKADDNNARNIRQWVKWFYNQAPSDCWGSRENVVRWVQERGAARKKAA